MLAEPKVESRRGNHGPTIVKVATRLFGQRGYVPTTMDDIAAGAGITKRTLYRYVASKQDVLLLIHENFLDAADRGMATSSSDSFAPRLHEFTSAYIRVVVRYQRAVRVYFEEQHNLQADPRQRIVQQRDSYELGLRQMIADGQEAGECRAGPVPVLAASVLGALAPTYRWYSQRGTLTADRIAEHLSTTLLTGIGTAPGGADVDTLIEFALDRAASVGSTSIPDSISTSATRLFATQGFLETTTQQIADAAAVRKSLLFYYIDSKDELLSTVLTRAAAEHLREFADTLRQTSGAEPSHRLVELIWLHAFVVARNRDEVRVLLDQTRHLSRANRLVVEGLQSDYLDAFQQVMASAMGPASSSDDARMNSLMTIGMLNWMCRWFDPDGGVDADTVGQLMSDIVLQGLAVGPRP